MSTELVAVLAGLVGLLTGAAAGLAFVVSERQQRTVTRAASDQSVLPPGVADVLTVLRSSAVVLDADDMVVRASPAAYSFGIVRGDRVVAADLLDLARSVRRHGEIREAELELPRGPLGDGTVSVLARVAPLGASFVLLLVEDRTEAKRVDQVRRDFVANISHELKTPVGAMALLAEAVLDAAGDADEVRRFAGRMQTESRRLSALVQDVIDLSRLQGHDPLRAPERVPVTTVVAEAVDRSRLAADAKDIRLTVRAADVLAVHDTDGLAVHDTDGLAVHDTDGLAVHDTDGLAVHDTDGLAVHDTDGLAVHDTDGLAVRGDAQQLVMALGNLVDNAVRHSPADTQVSVAVRGVTDGAADLVEISVSDEGPGIAEADRERVFERFYRVDDARSRDTGGTGLGLAIVKHVALSHGGEVTVWSAEGTGSTFTLRLPAAPADTEESA